MINQSIIKRYLNGEATEEDLNQLKTYLQGKDLSLLENCMAEDWSQTGELHEELPPDLSEEMLLNVREKISGSKEVRRGRQRSIRNWAAVAAIFLVPMIAIFLWWNRQQPLERFTTGFGEWKTVELPDGSWVKLNANSEISFAARWPEGQDRQVWLAGEAFFKVERKPQTGAKFRVVTDDLQVEVLGTSFNVNSRGEQTDVFLEEGTIRLSMGGREDSVDMQAGDFVAYSAAQQRVLARNKETPPEVHTSWKDGVLHLEDKSVKEILKRFEEIYGVKTKVLNDSLSGQILTIRIPMDKLEIALRVVESTLHTIGAETRQKDNQLIIQ